MKHTPQHGERAWESKPYSYCTTCRHVGPPHDVDPAYWEEECPGALGSVHEAAAHLRAISDISAMPKIENMEEKLRAEMRKLAKATTPPVPIRKGDV